jgi:hypothetical protein
MGRGRVTGDAEVTDGVVFALDILNEERENVKMNR